MTAKYAVLEDTGRRVLYEIECDGVGCTATIKPGPDISKSGWEKRSTYEDTYRGTVVLISDYCPKCRRSSA